MIKVIYKEELIANFRERKDAEHFLEWKREKILMDMNKNYWIKLMN